MVLSVWSLLCCHPQSISWAQFSPILPSQPLKMSLVCVTPSCRRGAHSTVVMTQSCFLRAGVAEHLRGELCSLAAGVRISSLPPTPLETFREPSNLCFCLFLCKKWEVVQVPTCNEMGLPWGWKERIHAKCIKQCAWLSVRAQWMFNDCSFRYYVP